MKRICFSVIYCLNLLDNLSEIFMKALTPRAKEVFPLVEAYLESGLTQKQFATTCHMTHGSFQWWVREYKKHQSTKNIHCHNTTGDFTPVPLSERPQREVMRCHFSFAGGHSLVIDNISNIETLLPLFRELKV